MKKHLMLLILLNVVVSPNLFAVKVQFKATPMSENLIKGPYAVYVFYRIFDDTTDVSGIPNIVDLPLLQRKDIKNVTIWKSGKLLKGVKPKFRKMDNKLRKSGIVRSFGITDYDVVQGDTYAYILYFNEAEKNGTRLKIVPEGDEDRDGPGLPTDEDLIGGGITTSTISLGNPDIAFAKLNNVFREAGHNNFQKNIISVSEGGFIKSLSYTRVIELDIRVNNSYNDWHVAHTGSSNDNNCGLNGNGMFSDCLNDIVSFHNTYNNHDPIMIYLDVKSDWTSTNGRSASDLDALLIQILGISNIYKPSDLRGSNASSSTAAKKNNWPSFEDLLGKYIVIVNGSKDKINEYTSERGSDAICFPMAGTYGPDEDNDVIMNLYDYTNNPDYAFYNFRLQDGWYPGWMSLAGFQDEWDDWPNTLTAPELASEIGGFTRVWSSNNTGGPGNYNEADFNSVVSNKINAIAVKNIDESRSYDENGILDQNEVDNPVLTNNHIYSTYNTVTQYGKYSITTDNLIVEPGTHYRLISGGPVIIDSINTVFKPGSNVEILEYQNLSSLLKKDVKLLTQAEIDEILKEVISELYNNQPIEDLKDNNLLVFPSPAKDYINIVFNNKTGEEVLIKVNDIKGALVKAQSFTAYNKGKQKISLHISDLPSGMYIFKLFLDNVNYSGKFIKK